MLLSRQLQNYLLGGVITCASVAFGVAPQLEIKPQFLSWDNQVIAQTISADQATDYAEAYLAIYSGDRMAQLLSKLEGLIGKKPDWTIQCNDAQSINKLRNPQAISMVRKYCNEELPALVDSIMSRSVFNDITNRLPNNPALQRQIENAMLEILKRRQTGNR
jgi:hypothetical protein